MNKPFCLILMPNPRGSNPQELQTYTRVGGFAPDTPGNLYAFVEVKDFNAIRDQLDRALKALSYYSNFNPADRIEAENALSDIQRMRES